MRSPLWFPVRNRHSYHARTRSQALAMSLRAQRGNLERGGSGYKNKAMSLRAQRGNLPARAELHS